MKDNGEVHNGKGLELKPGLMEPNMLVGGSRVMHVV
jgi:hypothetical protein